jgi:hypothetical protein
LVFIKFNVKSEDVQRSRGKGIAAGIVVYRITGEVLIYINSRWILCKNRETGLTKCLLILQEIIVVEVYDDVCTVEVV